jgi:hypothetical protein
MLKKWFRGLLSGVQATPAAKPQPRRLTLEALEDRWVLSPLVVRPIPNNLPLGPTLAQDIAGSGVQISNASFTGSPLAVGTFAGGTTDLGINSGIVLDTGTVASIPGTLTKGTGIPAGTNLGNPGDGTLNTTTGNTSHDAAVLTFNFVAQGPLVSLSFVFASNEYTVGTATALNPDTFAAYINGTNQALFINNPAASRNINPGNLVIAGIDRINDPTLAGNISPLDIRFDRISGVITLVPKAVVPGQVNTIKLVIADVGASALGDSAVFIQAQSFSASPRLLALYPVRNARSAPSTTFSGYITIQNLGDATLATTFTNPINGVTSRFGVAFPILPPGVTVTSNIPFVTNSQGQKYLPLPTSLGSGQFVRIAVKFTDTFHVPLPNFFNGQALDVQYFST